MYYYRLNRESISELQQQVEDLQKALQTQGAKPEDVSVLLSHKLRLTVQSTLPHLISLHYTPKYDELLNLNLQ